MKKLPTFIILSLLVVTCVGAAKDNRLRINEDGTLDRLATKRALEGTELARLSFVKHLSEDRKGGPLPHGTYFFTDDGNDFLRRYHVFRRSGSSLGVDGWMDKVEATLGEGFELKHATFLKAEEVRQDHRRIQNGGDPHKILEHVEKIWPPLEEWEGMEIVLNDRYAEADVSTLLANGDHALMITEAVECRSGERRHGLLRFRWQSHTNGPKEWMLYGQGAPKIAEFQSEIDRFLARFPDAVLAAGEFPIPPPGNSTD